MFVDTLGQDRRTFRRPSAAFGTAAVALLLVLSSSTAFAQATTTITIAWDRNTDAHTVGYTVYYGTSSGSDEFLHDAGNQTDCAADADARLDLLHQAPRLQLGRPSGAAFERGLGEPGGHATATATATTTAAATAAAATTTATAAAATATAATATTAAAADRRRCPLLRRLPRR